MGIRRQGWMCAIALTGCYGGLEVNPPPSGSAGTSGPQAPGGASEPTPTPTPTPTSSDDDDEGSSSSGSPPDATTSGSGEGTTGEVDDGSSSSGIAAQGCDALPDALLCEDFEEGIDPERWSVEESSGGVVTVEDGMLHVELGAMDGGHGFIKTQAGVALPVEGNRVFGRVHMLIEPAVPDNHSYILAAEGPLDGSTARYRLDVNGTRLNSRYTHASIEEHGGLRKMGRYAEPDVWTCIEWEYDGANNEMRYWFDGVLDEDMVVESTEDPPWTAPPFQSFELGYHTYQAPDSGDAFDIWFDDLALHTERIGCD